MNTVESELRKEYDLLLKKDKDLLNSCYREVRICNPDFSLFQRMRFAIQLFKERKGSD